MNQASALFVSLGFFALARRLGLVSRPYEVMATSRQAYRVFTDTSLSDDEKEAIMQQSARTLARQFIAISGASLAAFAAPFSVVCLMAALGLVSLKAVLAALVSWQVLLSGTVLIAAKGCYERVRVVGTR